MNQSNSEMSENLETLTNGVWKENPIFVTMLGLCATLAVSNTLINSLAMGLATTFVLIGSNALVSLLRHFIPKQIRIIAYIMIIATFVTVVDYAIQVISLQLYNALGAFIQLIVVNCIILGKAESYASKNPCGKAMLSALGAGLGFTLALACLGGVRELLGSGKLLGFQIFSDHFEPWVVMVLPPGGFMVLGCWLLLFKWLEQRKIAKQLHSDF